MSDEVKTTPQWGYSKSDARIFDLKDGESLPKSYYDSPAKVPGSEAMSKHQADAAAEGVSQPEPPKTPELPKVDPV